MPFCSARSMARSFRSSSLTRLAASSSRSSLRASRIRSLRRLVRPEPRFWNRPWSWLVISSMPGGAMISTPRGLADTWISISRSSSSPARSFSRNFSRVAAAGGRSALLLEARRGREQGIQDALLGRPLRLVPQLVHLLLAEHLHRDVRQVPDDGLHVPPHVAHLGELGGLDLDEGGVGESRQAPGDLGLAHPGGADHEDVLGRDLGAQGLADLHAPPAVAQRNGHRALGLVLTDDVLVELGDDLLGGEFGFRGHGDWGLNGPPGTRRLAVERCGCRWRSASRRGQARGGRRLALRRSPPAPRSPGCGWCRRRCRPRCAARAPRSPGRPAPCSPAGRGRRPGRRPPRSRWP